MKARWAGLLLVGVLLASTGKMGLPRVPLADVSCGQPLRPAPAASVTCTMHAVSVDGHQILGRPYPACDACTAGASGQDPSSADFTVSRSGGAGHALLFRDHVVVKKASHSAHACMGLHGA